MLVMGKPIPVLGKNHKGAIVTLDDLKSKLRLAASLPSKKAEDVKEATIALLHSIKQFAKTITFEMAKNSPGMKRLPMPWTVKPISLSLTIPGRAGRMRMPMAYCANILQQRLRALNLIL